MDPNTALEEALAACADYLSAVEGTADVGAPTAEEAASNLVNAFEALDGWLSRGGFLPRRWER